MKITMIGTGYVGLVSGACFAEMGHEVICMDCDSDRIEGLKRAEIPIYEPGLEELVRRNVEQERLSFTTDVKTAIENSLFIFICVGTPEGENGETELKAVLSVAKDIGNNMAEYKVIVNKSGQPQSGSVQPHRA